MIKTVETKLLCPRCRTITTIFRKKSKQKPKGHYKKLYCYVCKTTLNHIEIKNSLYTDKEIEKLIQEMKECGRYDYV